MQNHSRLAAFAAFASATSLAPASVITQYASASNIPIQVLGTNCEQQPAPYSINFQRFDPALGTLNRVTMRVAYAADASVGIENVEATAVSFSQASAGLVHNLRFNGDAANAPVGFFSGIRASSFTLPAFDGALDFAGASAFGGMRRYAQTIDYIYDTNILAVRSEFAPVLTQADGIMQSTFVGTQPLFAELFMQSIVSADPLGTRLLAVNQPTNERYGFDVVLTYDYTPIPAPASLACLAAVAMFATNRRRR